MSADYFVAVIIDNRQVLTYSFIFSFVYFLLSVIQKEPVGRTALGAFCGFISAPFLGPMIAIFFGYPEHDIYYVSGIAVCGHFVPQLIQSAIKTLKVDMLIDIVFRGNKK